MTASLKYEQVEGCLLEQMDNDALLYNPETATTLHLNSSSMLVWQLCNGESSVADIIDALQSAYPEQSEAIAADVESAVKELLKKGVLRAIEA